MLLSGITGKEFVVLYLVSIVGIVVRFLYNLWEGITKDIATPFTFQFKFFVKGLIRIIFSLIIMAVVIARFQEFSHLFGSIENVIAEGDNATIGLTAGSAFMLGMGVDELVKRVVSYSNDKLLLNIDETNFQPKK